MLPACGQVWRSCLLRKVSTDGSAGSNPGQLYLSTATPPSLDSYRITESPELEQVSSAHTLLPYRSKSRGAFVITISTGTQGVSVGAILAR